MFGIEINFKDGRKEWIDPVTNNPIEKDGILFVSNSAYTYEYVIDDIKEWFKYELCNKCQYDVRSYDCKDNECQNTRCA